MTVVNILLLVIIVIVSTLVGWIARKLYVKYAPTEKALALAALNKALAKVSSLASAGATPEAIAAAAAAQTHEQTLLQAVKDTAAKLT